MTDGSKSVPLTAACDVSPAEFREISAITESQWTLKAVLDWCLSQEPAVLDADVVTQDEFTHDLVVPLPGGYYLVYDST